MKMGKRKEGDTGFHKKNNQQTGKARGGMAGKLRSATLHSVSLPFYLILYIYLNPATTSKNKNLVSRSDKSNTSTT